MKLPFFLSSIVLVLSNLVPLIGVLFFGWNAVLVLALFWIENLFVGIFTILKMLCVILVNKRFAAIGFCLFFLVHYGIFFSGHGELLASVLDIEIPRIKTEFDDVPMATLFVRAYQIIMNFIDTFSPTIWLGLAALFLSQFVRFIEHFLLSGNIFKDRVEKLMMQPYGQVLILHVGLMVGAILLQKLGSPVWLLALLVILKMVVEFARLEKSHKAEKLAEQIKDI